MLGIEGWMSLAEWRLERVLMEINVIDSSDRNTSLQRGESAEGELWEMKQTK